MTRADDRELLKAAYEAWDAEDWAVAGERLERLVRRHADHRRAPVWWYDAALAHKFLGNWAKAYELGREAAARAERGTQDPAFWNLGIAATIMEDWATARDAWQGFGLSVPDGDGEIEADFGATPVRLECGEVVWARRLCPARARVLNVPTPESGRRFGEVVVHDGAPNGERTVNGQTFPVFDELLLFRASDLPTATVEVVAAAPEDIQALAALFDQHGYGAEPASGVRMICSCCSEGSVRQNTDHQVAGGQRMHVAAPADRIAGLLDAWCAGAPERRSWTGRVHG
ncbi:tetratricopeptide repeat protein [Micromonospora soli]|uniref:tetratricopeptide repeat protein n=1 Tax=Micromonospora sp. NBRC 110009 TaxID=3061627 RepID=UPI002671ED52|nr:tetratricopeptide repeat protein [Micromonospora sp. NBRC 110009]WKT99602.1 tetratricopeptide repeat protein [Micromonospora sp. NBRC 110009]